jgi:UDP-glucose-4-epimerase GalE
MAAWGLTPKFYTRPPRSANLPVAADAASRVSTLAPDRVTNVRDSHHCAIHCLRARIVAHPIRVVRGILGILITGGAGYIGSHTARALRRSGYEVVIYDNLSTGFRRLAQGFELVEGDVGDEARLRALFAPMRIDTVVHFAAHAYIGESVESPRKYFRNNAVAALGLLNAALDAGIRRFVFSSSCAVYGIPGQMPIVEGAARAPVNPYGASKLFFENALEAYGQAYGLRSVSLRYFNAAGADESGEIGEMHDPETHLIPLALAASATTGPELQVFGADYPTPDGTCIRDYIHVSDLADAHVRALQYLERDRNEKCGASPSLAVNLGTGRGYSVLEVVRAAECATGRPIRLLMGPRRLGDPPFLVADLALAKRILGWSAKRDLADMVSSAWMWMSKNRAQRAA